MEGGIEDELFWCEGLGFGEELCIVEGVEGWEVVFKSAEDGWWAVPGCVPNEEGLGINGRELMDSVRVLLADAGNSVLDGS